MEKLERTIRVGNVDGTLNQAGNITHSITLQVAYAGEHMEKVTFGITQLGRTTMILGHDWLKKHNPEVDWITGKVTMNRCPRSCRMAMHKRMDRLTRVEDDKEEEQARKDIENATISVVRTDEQEVEEEVLRLLDDGYDPFKSG